MVWKVTTTHLLAGALGCASGCGDDVGLGGSTAGTRGTSTTGDDTATTRDGAGSTETGSRSTGAADTTDSGPGDTTAAAASTDGDGGESTGRPDDDLPPWFWLAQAAGDPVAEYVDVALGPDEGLVAGGSFIGSVRINEAVILTADDSVAAFVAGYFVWGQYDGALLIDGPGRDAITAVERDDLGYYYAGHQGGGAVFSGVFPIPGEADQYFVGNLLDEGGAAPPTSIEYISDTPPADLALLGDDRLVLAAPTQLFVLDRADLTVLSTVSMPGVEIQAVAVGPRESLHLAGVYSGTVDIQGTVLTSSGESQDAFVAQLDGAGILQWVLTAGGDAQDAAHAISVGPTGTVYLAGTLEPGATVGSTDRRPTAVDIEDPAAFVAAYGGDGILEHVFATVGGGSEEAWGASAVDATRFVLGGHFRDDYDGTLRTAVDDTTAFVQIFDAAGARQQRIFSEGGAVELLGLDCVSDRCAVAGRFTGSMTLDTHDLVQRNEDHDAFVGVISTP